MTSLRSVTLDELTIDDEGSLAGVDLYRRLAAALRRSEHRFLVPEDGARITWDRVLFLNLTYGSGQPEAAAQEASDGGGSDVLCDDHIAADEVGHVAWHHVVGRELRRLAADPSAPISAEALFFSESIASAFDLYLIGRLLHVAPDSDFITTQVPLIAERAQDAGLSEGALAMLLEDIAREPERAFEDMRELLLDVANALLPCRGPAEAQRALTRFAGHRFEPLLHHFELSNWILYARAYGARDATPDAIVMRLDVILRAAPTALGWLAEHRIDADAAQTPA
jgi:hypothetical protein